MSDQDPTARREWGKNWPMVGAGLAGMSIGTIPTATLGLFMAPLQDEFGWSRAEISAGLTLFAIVSLPLAPLAGMLVDRFGPRRVAIPGIALSALMFALFAAMNGSLFVWFAVWTGYTLASLLTRSLVWTSAIASAFVKSRGMAIALVLCGSAVAMSLAPAYARWLIDSYGWRTGYLGIGLGWGGLVLLLIVLFFRDRRNDRTLRDSEGQAPMPVAPLGGLTVAEGLRTPTIYRIAFAMFLQSTMGAALIVHIVPLLVSKGITRVEAVGIVVLLGLAAIVGKLGAGWLGDKYSGSVLPVTVFTLPAVGYAILLAEQPPIALLGLAVITIGLASGGCLQQTIHLTTRYAGLRKYATIFGFISSMMALGGGIGPILAGGIHDATGDYRLLLIIAVPAAIVAGLAVLRLGAYPDWTVSTADR